MKIRIHHEKCIAAGNCVMIAPEVFDQNDDDGVVILLDENPPAALHDAVRKAAAACPALVIEIDE